MQPRSRGTEPEWAALEAHSAWARRLALRLVRCEHEAVDLVQETWVKALTRPPVEGWGLRAWWTRVMVRAARERRLQAEARRRRERSVAAAALRGCEESADQALVLVRRITEALHSLREPYRSTLVLRFYEGLPPRRIAERAGTRLATVKSRLHRGLELLRRELDETTPGGREAWLPRIGAWTGAGGLAGGGTASSGLTALLGGLTMLKTKLGLTLASACFLLLIGGMGARVFLAEESPAGGAAGVAPSSGGGEVDPDPLGGPRIERSAASELRAGSGADDAGREEPARARAPRAHLSIVLVDTEDRRLSGGTLELWEGTGALAGLLDERREARPEREVSADEPLELTDGELLVRPALADHLALERLELRGALADPLPEQILRMDRTRELRVRLRLPQGARLRGAMVRLRPDGAGRRLRGTGVEGIAVRALRSLALELEEGELSFARRIGCSETWHVEIVPEEFRPAYAAVQPGFGPVELEIPLEPEVGPRILGRVVDEQGLPVVGARISFPGASEVEVRSDASGGFRLYEVPFLTPARVEAQGFVPLRHLFGPEDLRHEVEIRLERGGALEGRVERADGRAWASALVEVLDAADENARSRETARTIADGTFAFPALRAGEWVVRVVDEAGATAASAFVEVPSLRVLLREGERPAGTRGVVLRVLDALDGSPLRGVAVHFSSFSEQGGWEVVREASTDEEGSCRAEDLPWTSLLLHLSYPGYVELTAGATLHDLGTRELEFRLAPERELEVRVLDARGRAAAEVQLLALTADGSVVNQRTGPSSWSSMRFTGPDGTARLSGLPAGPLRIFAQPEHYATTEPLVVDLSEATSSPRTLRLPVDVGGPRRSVRVEVVPPAAAREGERYELRVEAAGRPGCRVEIERLGTGWRVLLPVPRDEAGPLRFPLRVPIGVCEAVFEGAAGSTRVRLGGEESSVVLELR